MDDVAPTAPAVSTTPSSLTTTTASSSSPATTTAQVEAAISSTDIVKENSGEKEEGDKDIKQDNLKEGAKPEESTSITTNTKESMITPVSKNFEWRVDHCVVCTQCDAKSSHEEVYRDLSVNFVATPREASLSGAAKCRVADLILDFFKV